MGGFTLHEGGKPVQVLEVKDLEKLSEAGKIEWPTITKEEILDRSKGDYLSKTIVLFQTTWFVVQCIARAAYSLTVTELEVVTVAFASLTGVMYYFWWDKPLDVRCSIPVHLLDGRLRKIEGGIDKEDTGPQINRIPSLKVSAEELPEIVNPDPLSITSIQVDTSTPDPAPTRMQRFRTFRRGACEEYGTLFGLVYVFIGFPLAQFLRAFVDMMAGPGLGKDKSLRVPTFYSSDDDEHDPYVILAFVTCVATVFGAIHCIAWSFRFATSQEQWVWRISVILVSGLPISVVAFSFLEGIFIPTKENNHTWVALWELFVKFIWPGMMFLYVIARIVLLVYPFVALRALPPGAYVQVNWVSFLPHI